MRVNLFVRAYIGSESSYFSRSQERWPEPDRGEKNSLNREFSSGVGIVKGVPEKKLSMRVFFSSERRNLASFSWTSPFQKKNPP